MTLAGVDGRARSRPRSAHPLPAAAVDRRARSPVAASAAVAAGAFVAASVAAWPTAPGRRSRSPCRRRRPALLAAARAPRRARVRPAGGRAMTDALRYDDVTFTLSGCAGSPSSSRRQRSDPRWNVRAGGRAQRGPVSRPSCGRRTGWFRTSQAEPSPDVCSPAGRDTLEHAPRPACRRGWHSCPRTPGSSFVLDRVEEELAYGMENLGVDPL